jgi:drug/metabolite transporter (DMT)-like permease
MGKMDSAILAALCATVGFAAGDIFTALLARLVNGKASMLLLTIIKVLIYVPFILLWRHEYAHLDGETIAWIVLLGVLFTIAYVGFNMAFQVGKNPALVGVVAGCFPASASVVAVLFLGQRPSPLTVCLLLAVLGGVVLIGLPKEWRTSLSIDKGILLALLPLVCWGIFGALLNEPVHRINTAHAWFVVQSLVAVVMALGTLLLYNKGIPGIVRATTQKKAWKLAIPAGVIIGVAEALQAFSLSSGREIVIIETLLGSYPALYFLVAHKIFKEPLITRQWYGIGVVVVSIVLLSVGAIS